LRPAKTACLATLLALAAGGIFTRAGALAPPGKKSSVKRKTKSRKQAVPSWRAGQQTPTPERYKQIQQALIEKGYLTGAASGVWGPESINALKRFQQDQSLEPSGKLTSLSVIALGLGPRRDLTAREEPPPAADARTKK
jgi:peptidoglycan hydrolase-like protein with peptidoglycan-binding domain